MYDNRDILTILFSQILALEISRFVKTFKRPFCEPLDTTVILHPNSELNSDSDLAKMYDTLLKKCFKELIISLDTERTSARNLLRWYM